MQIWLQDRQAPAPPLPSARMTSETDHKRNKSQAHATVRISNYGSWKHGANLAARQTASNCSTLICMHNKQNKS